MLGNVDAGAAAPLIANVGEFAEFHALGGLMSAESLAYGWTAENIHPGALRAYREAGIIQ